MNYFESELRKLFEDRYPNATFVGRHCYVPFSDETRANICFKTRGYAVILEYIGYEHFLDIDFISEFTDYFVEGLIKRDHPWLYRYRISICSNGTLYFEPKVQEFIKKHFNYLSFSISVDGNKELHDACRVFHNSEGSYDKAIAAVNYYRDVLGGVIGSKMTLALGTIQYTYNAVRSLFETDYDDIHLNCVYE